MVDDNCDIDMSNLIEFDTILMGLNIFLYN